MSNFKPTLQLVEIELKSLNDLSNAYKQALDKAIEIWTEQDEECLYNFEYSSYTVALEHISFQKEIRSVELIAHFKINKI